MIQICNIFRILLTTFSACDKKPSRNANFSSAKNEKENYIIDYSTAGAQPSALTNIFEIAACILILVSEWRMFTKAGQPGWAAIIPFYNIYWAIKSDIKTAHAFGKSTGFGWGIVFLPYIFIPILGLGKAEYAGVQDM